ncbi:SusD/RagB family nutrient-binding outer membrane lipoprotein [Zunongwangia endophytica]|uniref:SusD/RagB family nutrient-binding outer membrane lipoprotein n=1 Tax=Zunongwangia endophytica TaxID=1808945 RepID=A0ABV8H8X3_9FLAO|nr:SusD/RagB family nutrient-binding outer membrane lipoprotein [Zunongwangia endophytica]MDN3594365.1 SusD/RagB family nutrient-binding outer membrane lipoprotein [Zunongwangia endophytica]
MNRIISVIFFVFLTFSFTNCSKIEDLQEDPNRATSVSPELLLTNIEERAFNNVSLSAALASRYLSYTNGVNSNQYYNWQRSSFDGYDDLKQVQKMVEASENAGIEVYKILGDFFNSYFIINITRTFGDVPYSEAILATESIYQPAYDSQKSIYLKVLNDLKSASDALALNTEQITGDVVFNGDKLKWRKLINSYYLRVLMSLSNKTEDNDLNIIERFQEIVNNQSKYPLMASNQDNAALNFYNIQGNRYPYFNDNDLQTAYFMEKNFVEKLQEFQDPRLFIFAERKPNAADATIDDFTAYGGLKGSEDLNINTSIAVSGEASRIAERYFFDPVNEPSILLSYWEQEFILSEAAVRSWITGDATEYYRNGISASFDFFETEIPEDYFDNEAIALNTDDPIQRIMQQKYISMFMNTGWQIFFEQRRTGFPDFNTDGSGILNNGQIPKRWMYPVEEATNNEENLEDAIRRQFPQGDNVNGKMWLLN